MSELGQGAEPDLSQVVKAVLFVLLAILCLDAMSVTVRLLLPRYSALELSAYRNILGILPSLAVMIWVGELRFRGTRLLIRQWPLAILRGFIVALAQVFYYAALGHLPYATIAALGFTSALFVVALSVPVLGEKVGVWRWGAVLIGFAGVLLVLRPGGDTFSLAALLPVGSAFCYALSTMTVRKFDRDVSNALIYLYSALSAAMAAALMAVFTVEFHPIASIADALMILFVGLIGGTAILFLMLGYRMVSPSIVAPFQYFALISALLIGYFMFGEMPIATLFPGVILIVASGLIILWRESRGKRR
ncbi:MAG: DMT family transporter [Rhodobacteraceae bacterium]|nr:DMT family transporter [Paracoccaceae bacterium]